MSEEHPSRIRTANIPELPGLSFRHPLNPNSKVFLRSLSARVGLQRIGLHVGGSRE